jgi:hypothetical protein
MKTVNETGSIFGHWRVIERALHPSSTTKYGWLCECLCGKRSVISGARLRGGLTKSCGCTKTSHGMTNTPTYKTWQSIWQRCSNKNDDHFERYGGRGISVCDEWADYEVFLSDMGVRPSGKTIDRVNNDMGYSKENCRWASPKQQTRNSTVTVLDELTVSYVLTANKYGVKNKDIARSIGLSRQSVTDICFGRTWVDCTPLPV